jgi:uncharacterized protein YbgA (DUF1722 family)
MKYNNNNNIFLIPYFPHNIKVSSEEQKCVQQLQWYRTGKVKVLKIK